MWIQLLLCFVLVLLSPESAKAQALEGEAHAKDGDDLVIAGKDVRLFGIDAFETSQMCEVGGALYACGLRAQEQLANKVFGRSVRCEQRAFDANRNRPVSICWAGNQELNAWMVSEGWAVAYRTFSLDYIDEEHQAREQKKGAWRGSFIPAWQWRRGKRLPSEVAAKPNPLLDQGSGVTECTIKGNISRDGERIYHLPGQEHYSETKISPEKGERFFCSEAEAVGAGWRKARR